MWSDNKIFTRIRISLILLLIISVRLVPFNLLHYHNNQFANFTALNNFDKPFSHEETISDDIPYCVFHKFLTLTAGSFVLASDALKVEPVIKNSASIFQIELRETSWLFAILNKGSPRLT